MKRVRIKRSNPQRRKRRFEENFGGKAYVEMITSLPCAVCGVLGYSQAAHVVPRGMGGAKGRASDLVPLCGPRPLRGYLLDGREVRGGNPLAMHPGCHWLVDHHLLDETRNQLKAYAAQLWAEWIATKTENE